MICPVRCVPQMAAAAAQLEMQLAFLENKLGADHLNVKA